MKHGVPLSYAVIAILVILVISSPIIIDMTVLHDSQPEIFFYIYGDSECPHCASMKEYIAENYGEDSYYFCDLRSNKTCLQKYIDLTTRIDAPQYVPLIILLNNCTVKAIIIGAVEDKEFLDRLLYSEDTGDTVPVYMDTIHIKNITVGNIEGFIAYYASGKTCETNISSIVGPASQITINTTWTRSPSLFDVLPQLLILAFLDSINPCTMTMYALFVASRKPGRHALISGSLFVLIIYIGYLVIALGLLAVVYLIPPWIYLFLAMILAVYNLARLGRRREPTCRECGILGKITGILSNDYLLSIFLALYSVIALLPCSAGPLFTFLAVIRDLSYLDAIIGLLLYNCIFIAPLLVILALIAVMGRMKRTVDWINRNSEVIGFLSSILLLFIIFILIIQY